MRVDLDYWAELLNVFIDSESAHVDFNDFSNSEFEVEDGANLSEKFIFHIQLAIDNKLIGTQQKPVYTLKDIGILFSGDGRPQISIVPWRLTQKGHDFAATLANKEVLEKLKVEFKDAPFKSIFDGGQKLLQHFFKKKIDSIIEE